MYRIVITKHAAENLKRLDRKTQAKILQRIDKLKQNPSQIGKQLTGPLRELRSLRAVGQRYRIIYKIIEDRVVVVVVALGLRKEGDKKDIYEMMKKYIQNKLRNE